MSSIKGKSIELAIYAIINLGAGLLLLIEPEGLSHWVIRGFGLIWVLDGVSYAFSAYINQVESKASKKTKNKDMNDIVGF